MQAGAPPALPARVRQRQRAPLPVFTMTSDGLRRFASVSDLPLRDGVGASCVDLPSGDWPTVVAFLCARFPAIGCGEWLRRIGCGAVVDGAGAALTADTPFRAHAKIFYYRSLPAEARIPFDEEVLYQDEHLVAADKPHFLPVTPAGAYLQETLLVRLKRRLGMATLTPMHRIDRDTAGVVLFTVAPGMRDRYQALFRARAVDKTYEALAPWRDDLALPLRYTSRLEESAAFMQMREVAGAVNAETTISVLARHGLFARYRLQPATGQKHQLRVHMAALGIPIVNDRIYPDLHAPIPAGMPPDYAHPLQLLARSIAFTDPVTGEQRFFESRRRLRF